MKRAFTLIELLIVLIIIGILVTLALPQLEGMVVRSKFKELYDTVAAIRKAEEIFYMETGFYAAADDEIPGYDLYYTITQNRVDAFKNILGIDIPGMNSVFTYGVYFINSVIYVRVRAHHVEWQHLCKYPLGGIYKGVWCINTNNPWSKYFRPPGEYMLYSAGGEGD